MKKCFFVLFVLAALLTAVSAVMAVPDNVSYHTTRSFLEKLDEEGIKYSYLGIDQDDDEKVRVVYSFSGGSLTVNLFFNKDNQECNLRVWNLVDIKAAYLESAYRVCNDLNSQYKFSKFYVDTTDNSITASYDMVLRDNRDAGDMVLEEMIRLIRICDTGYEDLKVLQ